MSDEYSDPNVIADMQAGWAADRRELKRLRAELSAKQREIDEALQLTECCSSLKQMAAMVIRGAKAEQELSDSLSKVRELVEAARLAEAAAVEKVRRLVEKVRLLVGLCTAPAWHPEREKKITATLINVQAALSEVEALIGKPQQEKESSPRYAETFCSQCGGAFGPGDSGFSHCEHHKGLRRIGL
jgi:hypothetical protein